MDRREFLTEVSTLAGLTPVLKNIMTAQGRDGDVLVIVADVGHEKAEGILAELKSLGLKGIIINPAIKAHVVNGEPTFIHYAHMHRPWTLGVAVLSNGQKIPRARWADRRSGLVCNFDEYYREVVRIYPNVTFEISRASEDAKE